MISQRSFSHQQERSSEGRNTDASGNLEPRLCLQVNTVGGLAFFGDASLVEEARAELLCEVVGDAGQSAQGGVPACINVRIL